MLGFGAWAVRQVPGPPSRRLALPVVVEGPASFRLLALWPQSPKYVRESHAALDAHEAWLVEGDAVVAGDLNSNTIWDRLHGARNHSVLVARLAGRGLVSAYHRHFGDAQGSESRATYYHYRHAHRPFHIDLIFIPESWWPRVRTVEVGLPEDWLGLSDHVPLVVEIELEMA